MFSAIADVLQLIVQPCYQLTGNWWAAIFLFTVITKVILMPMALWVQWNSIKMVQVMPELNRLKVKYFGDRETIGEKQNELNKKKHYHPMLSLVPLAVQIIILFGLVDVIHSITDSGTPGTEFLGLVPVEDGGLSWIMPVLAELNLDGNCFIIMFFTLVFVLASSADFPWINFVGLALLVLFLSLGAPNQPGSILIGVLIVVMYLNASGMVCAAIYSEAFLGAAQNLINVIGDIVMVAIEDSKEKARAEGA